MSHSEHPTAHSPEQAPEHSTGQPLLRTPLADWHIAHNAKMAPFAGWDMPIQYTGILVEHQHTRTQASVFDICHMGELIISGPDAAQALGSAVSHNLSTLRPERCRYGFILTEQGGIIDDCIVYCMSPERYMIVINGACADKDRSALSARLSAWRTTNPASRVELEDISAATAKIDLQGPLACDALEAVLGQSVRDIVYFGFRSVSWKGMDMLISRTGYTGELGYELYVPWDKALMLWEALLADTRVKPAGLGARDTLRLESGLPLYGQDLDEQHTPAEAGYGAMLTSTAQYVGKAGATRCTEQLIGLTIPGRRSARHLDVVCLPSGEEVGVITSGSFAPTLGHAVAFALVRTEYAAQADFIVRAAKTELAATRAALPFYTGTAREKLG